MEERLTLAQTKARREEKRRPSQVPPMVGNQYFKVYFGAVPISFSRVSNLQHTVEHEDFAEGGLNHHVHVLTRPNSQSGTLTLEKGVADEDVVTKLTRVGILLPGTRLLLPVTVTLYYRTEHFWKPVRSWGVEDGIVTGCRLSDLDAMGSEVAVERLELSHSGLIEIF